MDKDAFQNDSVASREVQAAVSHITQLEEALKNGIIHDETFVLNTIRELASLAPENDFMEYIKTKIADKRYIFIRHGQAQHNEYNIYHKNKTNKKRDFFDPYLTNEGIDQCKLMKDEICKLGFPIHLVFVSPLRRTLQTLDIVRDAFRSDVKHIIVTELAREQLKTWDTHVGSSLVDMKASYKESPHLNFDFITKEKWWSYTSDEEYNELHSNFNKEKDGEFLHRLILMVIWSILRDEKNICFVSHSKVYKVLHQLGDGIHALHGNMYQLDNSVLIDLVQKFLKNNL